MVPDPLFQYLVLSDAHHEYLLFGIKHTMIILLLGMDHTVIILLLGMDHTVIIFLLGIDILNRPFDYFVTAIRRLLYWQEHLPIHFRDGHYGLLPTASLSHVDHELYLDVARDPHS